jgi:fatty-acyl-CoA synthase
MGDAMFEKYWKPYFDKWTTNTGNFLEKILESKYVLGPISGLLNTAFRLKFALDRISHLLVRIVGLPTSREQKKILYWVTKLGGELEDVRSQLDALSQDQSRPFRELEMDQRVEAQTRVLLDTLNQKLNDIEMLSEYVNQKFVSNTHNSRESGVQSMDVNIAIWIARNACIFPLKRSLKDDQKELSYAELDRRIKALAEALSRGGVTKGDRVAVLMPNAIEMVEVLFAAARLGAIFVPLNWRLGEDELAFILDDCTPNALIYSTEWEDRVTSLKRRYREDIVYAGVNLGKGDSVYEGLISQIAPSQIAAVGQVGELIGGGHDPLMIIYTSGTTGLPKGVVLSHSNVFWQTINGWSLGMSPDSVCLVLLPLFHVGGLNGSVTPILHTGGTVILQRKFDAVTVLKTIEQEGVTGILGVPTIYQVLAQQPEFETTDWSRCEVLLSGGAPLPESLIKLYHERDLEFRQGYGLTEASPGVTGMGPGECLNKAGSAGRQILYIEVKIVDDDGKEQPTGTSGEIILRGPNVMIGYWNRPEETAKAIRDGWLYTGDIGLFDQDGFLYIVDRKKDMIISGGENIYPAEIEKLLAGHPDVGLATIVARKDERWGEVPVAVIVPTHKQVSEEQIEVKIHSYLEQRLARYKLPKEYHFVADLPLNAAGKVNKPEVRKMLGL